MTTSGALFPSLVPGSRGSSNKYLVEFRAGKMSLKGTTVTPDKRKGLVYIQQTDDSLIHFCWKDRTSGNVEDVSARWPGPAAAAPPWSAVGGIGGNPRGPVGAARLALPVGPALDDCGFPPSLGMLSRKLGVCNCSGRAQTPAWPSTPESLRWPLYVGFFVPQPDLFF